MKIHFKRRENEMGPRTVNPAELMGLKELSIGFVGPTNRPTKQLKSIGLRYLNSIIKEFWDSWKQKVGLVILSTNVI